MKIMFLVFGVIKSVFRMVGDFRNSYVNFLSFRLDQIFFFPHEDWTC